MEAISPSTDDTDDGHNSQTWTDGHNSQTWTDGHNSQTWTDVNDVIHL